MDFFWSTVETINRNECKGFEHFDTGHILWLVLFVCAALICAVSYKRRSSAGRRRQRLVMACLLLLGEMLKYVIVTMNGVSVIYYLPLQLCSICIVIIILHGLFTRGDPSKGISLYAGNFLYLVGLAAGLSALIFPSWMVLPAFANMMSIHSFTSHILFVSYIIMLMAAKEIRPEIKTIPVSVVALILMAFGVYRFDLAFDMNYMYLVSLSAGSPLGPFEALGDYRIGYAVILAGLVVLLYLLPKLFRFNSR